MIESEDASEDQTFNTVKHLTGNYAALTLLHSKSHQDAISHANFRATCSHKRPLNDHEQRDGMQETYLSASKPVAEGINVSKNRCMYVIVVVLVSV